MLKKSLSLLLITFLLLNQIVYWRSYPLKKVSKSTCRFTDWADHSDDCKMDLPIIENADYDKYKDNKTYRLLYSVLWTATYDNGWDIGYWSHLGVDFATARGTPVYAIWDGTVYMAKSSSWRWNAVVIAHKLTDKTIYSVYAHLNSINVKQWDTVKEWDKVWEVWHSWNAYGNHLHFQIDTNQTWFHPYYHNNCSTSSSIDDIVNGWLCQDYVTQNTIDPIYFLETNGATIVSATTQQQITQVSEDVKKEETIKPTEIVSRQYFLKTELDEFLSKYTINISSKISWNTMKVWSEWQISLKMYNKKTKKAFDDILMEKMKVEYDTGILSISPEWISLIDNGQRTITIKAKKTWTTIVNFKMFDRIIQSFTIRVVDSNTKVEAEHGYVYTFGIPYIWWENFGLVLLKDANYANILDIPYSWNFILKSNDNSLLCPIYITSKKDISKLNNRDCNTPSLVNSVTFDYSKTFRWVLLFKVLPKQEWELSINVYKWNEKIWANIQRQIYFPATATQKDNYTTYVKQSLSKLFVRNLLEWNFWMDYSLKESDAIYWINNTFENSKTKTWSKFKYLTRLEFMKLLSDMTGIKSKQNKQFLDVATTDTSYSNILIDYSAKFLDDFGEKYFQPDLKITRKEAAYILLKIKTKK